MMQSSRAAPRGEPDGREGKWSGVCAGARAAGREPDAGSGPNWRAEEERFLEELGSDVLDNLPRLVFIRSAECDACPSDFRITDYLESHGWTERYLAAYRRLEPLGGYAIYERTPRGLVRGGEAVAP